MSGIYLRSVTQKKPPILNYPPLKLLLTLSLKFKPWSPPPVQLSPAVNRLLASDPRAVHHGASSSHSGSGQHAEAPSQQQRSMHGGSLSSHPIASRDGDWRNPYPHPGQSELPRKERRSMPRLTIKGGDATQTVRLSHRWMMLMLVSLNTWGNKATCVWESALASGRAWSRLRRVNMLNGSTKLRSRELRLRSPQPSLPATYPTGWNGSPNAS